MSKNLLIKPPAILSGQQNLVVPLASAAHAAPKIATASQY